MKKKIQTKTEELKQKRKVHNLNKIFVQNLQFRSCCNIFSNDSFAGNSKTIAVLLLPHSIKHDSAYVYGQEFKLIKKKTQALQLALVGLANYFFEKKNVKTNKINSRVVQNFKGDGRSTDHVFIPLTLLPDFFFAKFMLLQKQSIHSSQQTFLFSCLFLITCTHLLTWGAEEYFCILVLQEKPIKKISAHLARPKTHVNSIYDLLGKFSIIYAN